MADTTTTRRALLGAISLAPVAGLLAAVPVVAAKSEAGANRHAWDQAMRAYEAAKAADALINARYEQVYPRYEAEADAIPHVSFPTDLIGVAGFDEATTANNQLVAYVRRYVAEVDSGRAKLDPRFPYLQEQLASYRRIVAAAEERAAAVAVVRARYGMDAIEEEWEQAGERVCDACSALMRIPAPDLAALRWKLNEVLELDSTKASDSWEAHYVEVLRSDIKRLLPIDSALGGEA